MTVLGPRDQIRPGTWRPGIAWQPPTKEQIERYEAEARARNERLIAGMCNTFQAVDRTIAGDPHLRVRAESDPDGPAGRSNGTEIVLNAAKLKGGLSQEGVREFMGVNEHEFLHIRYTPRRSSAMGQWVMSMPGMFPIMNMLEDQRIERLGIIDYPSVKPWLQIAVLEQVMLPVLGTPGQRMQYMLLVGRHHVPVQFRMAYRRGFIRLLKDNNLDPMLVNEVKDLVLKYLGVVFPNHLEEAKVILTRFKEIYDMLPQQPGGDDGTKCKHQPGTGGAPVDPDEQIEMQGRSKIKDDESEDEEDTKAPDLPSDDEKEQKRQAELEKYQKKILTEKNRECPCGCGEHETPVSVVHDRVEDWWAPREWNGEDDGDDYL